MAELLTESQANTIRGKMLASHATVAEQMDLLTHLDLVEQRLRGALETLRGCFPQKIYIFGAYGDQWSEAAPDPHEIPEFEVFDFAEVLDGVGGAR